MPINANAALDSWLPSTTERFCIRRFRDSEHRWLYELEKDAYLKRYLGESGYQCVGPFEQWHERALSHIARRIYQLCVAKRDDDQPVGTCGLTRFETIDWEIRIILRPDNTAKSKRGIEIAKHLIDVAFEVLKADSVVAMVHGENHGACRLVEDLGFEKSQSHSHENPEKQHWCLSRSKWDMVHRASLSGRRTV